MTVREDPILRRCWFTVVGVLVFVLLATMVAIIQVYAYEPIQSWLHGQPYTWDNWYYLIARFGLPYFMLVSAVVYALYLMHKLPTWLEAKK